MSGCLIVGRQILQELVALRSCGLGSAESQLAGIASGLAAERMAAADAAVAALLDGDEKK